MSRPYTLPDPNDRSVNNPSLIVDGTQVLGLYNQENKADKKERVVESVKEFYKNTAMEQGWNTVSFHGSQAVLVANVRLGENR